MPTMNSVFDMVKVVDFALQEGKVGFVVTVGGMMLCLINLIKCWCWLGCNSLPCWFGWVKFI